MENYFEETDLDVDFGEDFNDIESIEEVNDYEENKQRTEEWRKQRLGLLTGSKGLLIMKCNRKGSKLPWNDKRKIFEFSESIIPYIYECVMERKTGRYIETASNLAMKYGTIIEPLIKKRLTEEYTGIEELQLKDVGFKKFDNIPTIGASADGVFFDKKDRPVMVMEAKACVNWSTHYKRTYEKTDDSSMDYWQMIIEMAAWGVNKALYVVISPPNNILRYINEPDIMDAYTDWVKETEMSVEEVCISEIHIEALKQRVSIMESVIQKNISTNNRIDELLEQEINFHKSKLSNEDYIFEDEYEKEQEQQEKKEEKEDYAPEIDFDNSIF